MVLVERSKFGDDCIKEIIMVNIEYDGLYLCCLVCWLLVICGYLNLKLINIK